MAKGNYLIRKEMVKGDLEHQEGRKNNGKSKTVSECSGLFFLCWVFKNYVWQLRQNDDILSCVKKKKKIAEKKEKKEQYLRRKIKSHWYNLWHLLLPSKASVEEIGDGVFLFIYSVNIEHPLYVRYCSIHWSFSSEQKRGRTRQRFISNPVLP